MLFEITVNLGDLMSGQDYSSSLCLQQSHTYTGGRLNKKDGLTRYGDSHVKDKTS